MKKHWVWDDRASDERKRARKERRARKLRRMVYLRDANLIDFACLDETTGHYRVWKHDDPKRVADYWPSTGTVMARGDRQDGIEALLRVIGVEEPVRAHRPPHLR